MSGGKWSKPTISCMDVQCRFPIEVKDGLVECSGTQIGDNCTISCVGRAIGQTSQLTCSNRGEWIGDVPECRIPQCPSLLPPTNGFWSCADGFDVGVSCALTCERGYHFEINSTKEQVSAPTVTCGSSLRWAGRALEGSCVRTFCNATSFPEIDSSQVGLLKATCGSIASRDDVIVECIFNCAKGYRPVGSQSSACQPSGLWTADPPICMPLKCPPILLPENAIAKSVTDLIENAVGSEVRYSCARGYQIQILDESEDIYNENGLSFVTRKCSGEGVWEGADIMCVPLRCSQPEAPANGFITTRGDVTLGSVVSYKCNNGYRFASEHSSRRCELQPNQTVSWNSAVPICEPVTCDAVPNVPHSDVVCSAGGVNCNATFGSVCHFSCHSGYHLSSMFATRTCLANGEWSPDTISCQPVTCPIPQPFVHGNVSCPHGPTFGQECSWVCQKGYHVTTKSATSRFVSRSCDQNGHWNDTIPTCSQVTCPILPNPANGLATVSGAIRYRSVAVYSCDAGYKLSSPVNIRECGIDGKWTQSAPLCLNVHCPSPASNHQTAKCSDSDFGVGSECSFHCDEGYELSVTSAEQNLKITCGINSQWSHRAPVCNKISCGLPVLPEDSFAKMSCTGTNVGDVCQFECPSPSKFISGTLQRECFANRTWSGESPLCSKLPEMVDLALNKQTAQSSTKYDGHPWLAVTADKNDLEVKCTHTLVEPNPWWRVDLGAPVQVQAVRIEVDSECSNADLEDIEIRAGNSLVDDGNANALCAGGVHLTRDQPLTVSCGNRIAQFVTVRASGRVRTLSLCRVKVFGEKPETKFNQFVFPGEVNLAHAMPTAQSNGSHSDGCVLVESSTHNPWWRVDLGSVRTVNHVTFRTPDFALNNQPFEVRVGYSSINDGNSNPVCRTGLSKDDLIAECRNLTGQFVNIRALGPTKQFQLCDIRVWGPERVPQPLVDLALYKESSIVSRTDTSSSCVTTFATDNPWWQSHLQAPSTIDHVIVNVGDHESPLLTVSVIGESAVQCEQPKAAVAGRPVLFKCHNIVGQHIRVMAQGWNQVLSVCRVEVWGRIV
eukprot:c7476_g1_i1.p1 GENE.c7476_g1_i1~~c7476_g1_i1.p1  ORF type:complete len:1072 (+),score=291.51 c7476_g1_i1:26-3217(+)